MNIQGKTILITGGGSGIGLEAARQFLEQGAKVIITGRSLPKLQAAKNLYPALTIIQSDAGSIEESNELFRQVKALGGIDILYNNAGVMDSASNLGKASDKHLESARYEMEINYLGVIHLNNLFLDMLKSRKEAAIIITTSILSYVPSIVETTYSASKVALRFYTETLRKHLEILNSNVKVFELLPPVVATEMTAERTGKKITATHLIDRLITGIKKNRFTIKVGDTKAVYFMSRFFPGLAFNLVNPKKTYQQLK